MLVVKKMFLMCALVLTLGLAVGCNKDTNGDDVNNAVTVQADLSDVQVDVGEYKNMAVEVTKIADITDDVPHGAGIWSVAVGRSITMDTEKKKVLVLHDW